MLLTAALTSCSRQTRHREHLTIYRITKYALSLNIYQRQLTVCSTIVWVPATNKGQLLIFHVSFVCYNQPLRFGSKYDQNISPHRLIIVIVILLVLV